MKKTAMKNTVRMIRRTRSRFLTLLAIIAIGIAFFMGVYSSSTVMKQSVDGYDDTYNLKDITIYSGYGFTDDDLEAIEACDGVKSAEGKKFADVSATDGEESYIARVHSYDPDDEINSFELVEGRLPENDHEALAEYSSGDVSYFKAGDTVTLSRPDDDLDTYLSEDTYTIVGLVQTPLYLDHSKETSTLSSRSLDTFLYVNESAFALEYDTEVDILTEDGRSYDCFSDAYDEYIDSVEKNLEELASTQEDEIYNTLKEEALSSYNDSLASYKEQANDFEAQIQEAEDTIAAKQSEIDSGWQEIEESEQTLAEKEAELNSTEQTKTAELDDAESQLTDGINQLDDAVSQITPLKEQAEQLLEQEKTLLENQLNLTALQSSLSQLDETLVLSDVLGEDDPLRESMAALDADWTGKTVQQLQEEISAKLSEIESGLTQIEEGLSSIRESLKQYDSSTAETIVTTESTLAEAADVDSIASTISTLEDLYGQLVDHSLQNLSDQKNDLSRQLESVRQGREQLQSSLAEGRSEIAAARQQIEDSRSQLSAGQSELEEAETELVSQKEEGQAQLDDAAAQLADAKEQIDAMEANSWTILTREQHYASVSFEASADQMAAIGFLFPIFFILVAGLVCMTTMSRTVREERGEIGILRALGYSEFDCMKKYLIYAFMACIIGEVGGVIIGMAIFPAVVYNTWKLMYTLPEMVLAMDVKLYLMMDLVFMGVMLGTTVLTAGSEMKEVPAQLLRPKAPKAGRRMLLERWTSLWKKISFSWKVTIRNIVRDPRRFFMTIAGVAGCTALLVTGFGVRDSLNDMVSIQYDEVFQYQVRADVSEQLTDSEVQTLAEKIGEMDGVTGVQTIHAFTSCAEDPDGTEHSFTVELFADDEEAEKAVHLRTREGHDALSIADGAVIDEKLSELLEVKVGDTITLQDEDGDDISVKVSGIAEMYIGHVCFMSESTYEEAAGAKASSVSLLLKTEGDTEELKDALMQEADLTSLTFADSERESVDTMIQSIGIIIVVIILSSMMLAFVVLGNLIDVNIAEREREIATLKVLGFRKKEVENYIFRENNVLTVIGAVCGVPLGLLLHHQIMKMVETEQMMLGRTVAVPSMIISVCLTVGFGLLVNLFMRKRIHKVKMAESLKSVE